MHEDYLVIHEWNPQIVELSEILNRCGFVFEGQRMMHPSELSNRGCISPADGYTYASYGDVRGLLQIRMITNNGEGVAWLYPQENPDINLRVVKFTAMSIQIIITPNDPRCITWGALNG